MGSANQMQARYFREYLEVQRAELAGELAVYVRNLTRSITMRHARHLRGRIRHTENEIRSIERMVAALDECFP
jgi:hypothetical protein